MAEKAKNPPKVRPTPYSKPILLTGDRSGRKRKSITWHSDETITRVHYFEYIADERVNVSKLNNNLELQNDPNNASSAAGIAANNNNNATVSSSSSPNANVNKLPNNALGGKISNASVDPIHRMPSNGKNETEKYIVYLSWRPLALIDFTPEMPSPGWNSTERSAQAERETYVLGAIDLPGQTSTLDEPDGQGAIQSSSSSSSITTTSPATTTTTIVSNSTTITTATDTTKSDEGQHNNDASNGGGNKDEASSVKIIPLENPEGMFTEYPDMYNSEIVNGVRIPTDNPQPIVQNMTPFCNQQSQLLPNQFQQQIINVTQNPFTFQEMSAQFHPQQFPFQQQHQAPFPQAPFAPNHPQDQQPQPQTHQQQQQQQPPQQVIQQQPMPFADQQAGLTGPIMPWLNYPFNQVNENSHAHLFRRPAT